MQASEQAKQQEPAVVQVLETQPVDRTELIVAWREFAAKLPREETAMSHRMDNMEPMLQEDGVTFLVIADNPSILNDLGKMQLRIENYLRQRLRNGQLHMTTRLREVTDKKRIYSRKEMFQIMLQQSEGLRKLTAEFELVLN